MTKPQVDTLKGVAIIEVIVIHFMALFPESWWFQNNLRSVLMVSIDQIFRMSIPVFIFLSWYGLSKKYKGQPVNLVEFWKSRVVKLVPLYLIWAVGIWVMMQRIPGWRFNQEIPLYLKIILGQSDYHLYFVPLIIVLYFVFGLYTYLPKTLRLVGLGIIGLVTLWWYSYLPTFRAGITWIQPDQIQYLVPLTWFWYAWLGGVAADYHFSTYLAKPLLKRFLLGLTILAAGLLIRDAYFTIHSGVYVSVLLAMQFTRWPVLVYATTLILLLLSTVGHWGEHKTLLSKVGVFSFFVFLAHTSFLRLFPAQWLHPVPLNEWLIGASVTAVLLFLSTFFMV
ncbi:acyltransferase [soil metagenome]